VPGYVAPPTQANKTSARPSLKQLLGQLEHLRGPDAFEARALIRRMATKLERRAFLEAAIADVGGTPLPAYDAVAPILPSKGQRRTERARKASSPDRVAHAVVLKALDEMELSGRGADAAKTIRAWTLTLLADHRRLAAHRDRKLSPAGLCRAAGAVGLDGGAPSLQTARAAAHMLAAQLPGVFGGGLYLRRYLRLAKGLAAQQPVTPRTVADAWNYAQNASSVESEVVQNGAVGREGIGAVTAQLSRIRVPGPLTPEADSGTRVTRGCYVFHWEPERSLLEGKPAQAGPAAAAAVDEGPRAAMPPGEKDGSTIGTPGAPAALAGEEAGRAPASSAGARRAQPPGGHAARVLTASAWMHRNPGLMGVLAGSPSGMVLGHGTPAALAEKLLENQAQVLAQLGQGFRVTRARVRVVAADLIRALRCGDLTRSADGAVAVPSFVTHQALAMFDIKTRPTAKAISPAMAKHLASLGVDPSGLSQRDARVLSMVLYGRRRSGRLSYRQLVAIAEAGGYGPLDLSQWAVFEARQEHFGDIMRTAWRSVPGADLADSDAPVAEPQAAGFAISPPGRRYVLRPFAAEPDNGKPQQHPEILAMHARLDEARAAGFATIRQRLPALRLALVQTATLKWYAEVLGVEVTELTDEQKAEAPDAKAIDSRERFLALAAMPHSSKAEASVVDTTRDILCSLIGSDLGSMMCAAPQQAVPTPAVCAAPHLQVQPTERYVDGLLAGCTGVGRIDALRRYEELIRGASGPCSLQACDLDEAVLLFGDLDDLAANEHPDAADLDFPAWAHIDNDEDMADFETRRTGT